MLRKALIIKVFRVFKCLHETINFTLFGSEDVMKLRYHAESRDDETNSEFSPVQCYLNSLMVK